MNRLIQSILVCAIAGLLFALSSLARAEDIRLAIKGYDPVAYFTDAKALIGDAKFTYNWDGVTFRFASAEHQSLFETDPDRYIPQHHNLCTASLSRGQKVIADPNNWLIYEGRLYLFGGPIGPGLFLANAAVMRERADSNLATIEQQSTQ